VLGIGGTLGAGKSSIGIALAQAYSYTHLDVDQLGHLALEHLQDTIIQIFGTSICGADGRIQRSALGLLVFSDSHAKSKLESIVHPWMKDKIIQAIHSAHEQGSGIIINAALLFVMGLHEFCDHIIWVKTPYLIRWQRIRKRDSLSESAIRARINAQTTLAPKALHFYADTLVVVNRYLRQSLKICLAGLEYWYGKKQNLAYGKRWTCNRRRLGFTGYLAVYTKKK
jgi:dephospho-CoA kinase